MCQWRSALMGIAALAGLCSACVTGATADGPNASGAGGAKGDGAGGATAGSGGATTAGAGGATAGSGGATATGTGGATATGTGGATATGAGGATATGAGGATTAGAGGAIAGSGGAGAGTGGATGTGTACPGVPIMPDAMGMVATGSNTVAIHGSWFEYSDCTDLKNVNCSTVTTPPANSFPNTGGKMCTSGHTSMASGAWGAGIGLELNDGPPQMPYDTTAHNVIGFCFVLSGTTIPSTGIRVAFPTKNNNDNAYFEAVTTTGQHTVLFSDTAQGSWVTTKSAFEPKLVMLLQMQIPSSTTAPVPWDFCIEGLTAITQ
jgi:hypothetical protein